MAGFALLVLSVGGYNEAVGTVLFIDVLGILFLLAAVVLRYVVKTS
jgi:hypothetical protein